MPWAGTQKELREIPLLDSKNREWLVSSSRVPAFGAAHARIAGFTMRRSFRGMTLNIEVRNPDGVSKGVKRLTVDRRRMAGNFIPLDRLHDGACIVAALG